MFRTAFNVGYVTAGILRLGIDELDGVSASNPRFDPEFFVDVIFGSEVDAATMAGVPASPAGVWGHVEHRKGGHAGAEGDDEADAGHTGGVDHTADPVFAIGDDDGNDDDDMDELPSVSAEPSPPSRIRCILSLNADCHCFMPVCVYVCTQAS